MVATSFYRTGLFWGAALALVQAAVGQTSASTPATPDRSQSVEVEGTANNNLRIRFLGCEQAQSLAHLVAASNYSSTLTPAMCAEWCTTRDPELTRFHIDYNSWSTSNETVPTCRCTSASYSYGNAVDVLQCNTSKCADGSACGNSRDARTVAVYELE
ncbi:hypothetical protein BC832DRAFT_545821 [Gaertneriomyces semiglobifer]|nr:hypothetical protein BC832DRAFT_545821 [Gaertneriomyces semiglobifer]